LENLIGVIIRSSILVLLLVQIFKVTVNIAVWRLQDYGDTNFPSNSGARERHLYLKVDMSAANNIRFFSRTAYQNRRWVTPLDLWPTRLIKHLTHNPFDPEIPRNSATFRAQNSTRSWKFPTKFCTVSTDSCRLLSAIFALSRGFSHNSLPTSESRIIF
jgi:hypothetical protein